MLRVVRASVGLPVELRGAAIAIGNFDGLHRGHRAVLTAMLERAKALNIPPAVMTFEPHPRMFFTPGHAPHRIEPLHCKLRRLREMGVEIVYIHRFNKALSSLSAEDFAGGILSEKLGIKYVVTGEDFVFGHQRGGNSATLAQMAQDGLFGYSAVPALEVVGAPCSSSRIRAHLAAAEMTQAAELLGRPYEISGRVAHGDGRGRSLGAPTANLLLHDIFLPAYGVYAVRYRPSDGRLRDEVHGWRDGVANLGVRPTFGGSEPRLEVHGFDECHDLYGQRLRVRLLSYLRPEQKFDSGAALRERIAEDIQHAKEALRQC